MTPGKLGKERVEVVVHTAGCNQHTGLESSTAQSTAGCTWSAGTAGIAGA